MRWYYFNGIYDCFNNSQKVESHHNTPKKKEKLPFLSLEENIIFDDFEIYEEKASS